MKSRIFSPRRALAARIMPRPPARLNTFLTRTPIAMQQPRLLECVRAVARLRHLSLRTEQAYSDWIRRFVLFHGKRHPSEMGVEEVRQFLSHLAVDGKVSASTQNQALCALLFLYCDVLRVGPPRRGAGEDGYDLRMIQELRGHAVEGKPRRRCDRRGFFFRIAQGSPANLMTQEYTSHLNPPVIPIFSDINPIRPRLPPRRGKSCAPPWPTRCRTPRRASPTAVTRRI